MCVSDIQFAVHAHVVEHAPFRLLLSRPFHWQHPLLCRLKDLPRGDVEGSVYDPTHPSHRVSIPHRPRKVQLVSQFPSVFHSRSLSQPRPAHSPLSLYLFKLLAPLLAVSVPGLVSVSAITSPLKLSLGTGTQGSCQESVHGACFLARRFLYRPPHSIQPHSHPQPARVTKAPFSHASSLLATASEPP